MHTGQGRELLVAQDLVGGEVSGGDADQVVGIAEQSLGMTDLRDLGELLFEVRDRGCVLAIHRHVDDHLETETDGRRVDEGAIAADGAVSFEAAQPPMARRNAELDPIGEFRQRDTTISLKLGKDFPVYRVHREKHSKQLPFKG